MTFDITLPAITYNHDVLGLAFLTVCIGLAELVSNRTYRLPVALTFMFIGTCSLLNGFGLMTYQLPTVLIVALTVFSFVYSDVLQKRSRNKK